MPTTTFLSPAKANLFLSIQGRRNDGYHDIRTIFQKISLYDEITIHITRQKGISISTDSLDIPTDGHNLAYKAAAAALHRTETEAGARIHITKRIPVGAGLGGGSSNAATTLQGLTKLLSLRWPEDEKLRCAASLGADVPFFMSSAGTALATGTGDIITPLGLGPRLWFLVLFPHFSVSTAWAYGAYDKSNNLLTKDKKNNNITNYFSGFKQVVQLLANDFETVISDRHPEVQALKEGLTRAGAAGTLLSGSGSAVFGIFEAEEEVRKACDKIPRNLYSKIFIAHSL